MSRGRRTAERLPWCGACDESSRLVDLPDGRAARCPVCHVAATKARDDKGAARRRRHERSLGLTDALCPGCGTPVLKNHRCKATALDPRSPAHHASIREAHLGGDPL